MNNRGFVWLPILVAILIISTGTLVYLVFFAYPLNRQSQGGLSQTASSTLYGSMYAYSSGCAAPASSTPVLMPNVTTAPYKFVKDNEHVYYCAFNDTRATYTVLPSADPATFSLIPATLSVEEARPGAYSFVQRDFAKDKNHVWHVVGVRGADGNLQASIEKTNADPSTFTVFTSDGTYNAAYFDLSKDKTHVYYAAEGEFGGFYQPLQILPGADPSFAPLISTNAGYPPNTHCALFWGDKQHVYYNASRGVNRGDVPLKVVEEADPRSLVQLYTSSGSTTPFLKDARHVYTYDLMGAYGCGVATTSVQKNIADPVSFKVLNDNYSKDNQQVYYLNENETGLVALADADPATFVVLADRYARDKRHIFYMDSVVAEADPASFTLLTPVAPYYVDAKDSNYYYAAGEVAPDPSTVADLPDGHGDTTSYSKDARYVYFGRSLISGAARASFQVLSDQNVIPVLYAGYAKDATHVYIFGKILPGADAATFTVLKSYLSDSAKVALPYDFANYAKDISHVYFLNSFSDLAAPRLVGEADPASFVSFGEARPCSAGATRNCYMDAQDARHAYLGGQVVQ